MSTQYHVYGNGGSGPVDFSTPIATVSGTTWSSSALAAGSAWRFAVRAFDTGTLLEEKNVDAQVSIALDASSVDVSRFPPAPILPSVVPGPNGSVMVHWAYPLAGLRPTGFHVYAGVGSPGYGSPAATVPYAAKPFFRTALTGYSDGATVAVCVRAYNSAGEETNAVVATAIAAAAGPATVDSLASSAVAGGS